MTGWLCKANDFWQHCAEILKASFMGSDWPLASAHVWPSRNGSGSATERMLLHRGGHSLRMTPEDWTLVMKQQWVTLSQN